MRALVLLVALGSALAQAAPDSYGYLTVAQQTLFATYAKAHNISPTPAEYNRLPESTRTTFEAVTDALAKVRLTDRDTGAPLGSAVDLVTAAPMIWGELPGNTEGRDQFRLSVRLKPNAVNMLERSKEFKKAWRGWGHVKLPDAKLLTELDADSSREKGKRPTLQVGWLEKDFMVGDIDVDYRESAGDGDHFAPSNSDVRSSTPTELHYRKHVRDYHMPPVPDLFRWW